MEVPYMSIATSTGWMEYQGPLATAPFEEQFGMPCMQNPKFMKAVEAFARTEAEHNITKEKLADAEAKCERHLAQLTSRGRKMKEQKAAWDEESRHLKQIIEEQQERLVNMEDALSDFNSVRESRDRALKKIGKLEAENTSLKVEVAKAMEVDDTLRNAIVVLEEDRSVRESEVEKLEEDNRALSYKVHRMSEELQKYRDLMQEMQNATQQKPQCSMVPLQCASIRACGTLDWLADFVSGMGSSQRVRSCTASFLAGSSVQDASSALQSHSTSEATVNAEDIWRAKEEVPATVDPMDNSDSDDGLTSISLAALSFTRASSTAPSTSFQDPDLGNGLCMETLEYNVCQCKTSQDALSVGIEAALDKEVEP